MSENVSGRASLLTPLGRGAVAVVAAEGEAAFAAVDAAFVAANGRTIREQRVDRILFGHWISGAHREEVVVIRDGKAVEIHCHGGLAASERILAALAAAGCTIEAWPDRTHRVAASTIQAEADIALAQATTKRTAAILLAQREGALQRAVGGVCGELAAGRTAVASDLLDGLLSRAALGLHLTAPWHVAIAGRPNVGKSCLINALVGYERAIVFDQPGTTRDVLTAETAIDGWPVRLADAAGIRETDDELEAEGVHRARRQVGEADLVLWVVDSTAVEGDPWQAAHDEWLAVVGQPFDAARTLIVANKVDLVDAGACSPWLRQGVARRVTLPTGVPTGMATDPLAEPGAAMVSSISALTAQGMPELIAAIGLRLVPAAPAGEGVPFTLRQIELLDQARARIIGDQPAAALEALSLLAS